MQSNRLIQILPQSHEGFLAGCRLYQARPDTGYSLTDDISMEIMQLGRLNFKAKADHRWWLSEHG
jgi:hypothetical protein